MGSGEAWGALEKPFRMAMSHIPLNHLDSDGCLFVSSPSFLLIKLAFWGGKARVGFAVRCDWSAAAC